MTQSPLIPMTWCCNSDSSQTLKAEMVAKALLDFPVHIRGAGWDHVDFSGGRASYVNACNYNESRDLIRHSLGLIDMSPNTALSPA
jgi:hypothetical protein